MENELKNMLQEAEAQHAKLVVLHVQMTEQLSKLTEDSKKLIHTLTVSNGEIQAYRKALEIINKHKE